MFARADAQETNAREWKTISKKWGCADGANGDRW